MNNQKTFFQNNKHWQRPQTIWVITIINSLIIGFVVLGFSLQQTVLASTAQINTATTSSMQSVIPYHGMLTDNTGTPLNGSNDFTFRIFTTNTGGMAVWSETHIDVPIIAGQFTVDLGSKSGGLPNSVRGSAYYLETVLNGETLSPREGIQIASQSLGSIIAMDRVGAPSSTGLNNDSSSIVSETVSLNHNAQAFVTLTCDCYTKNGGVIISDLRVNGVRADGASVIAGAWPNNTSNHTNGNRYTASQTYIVSLDAGENLIEMQSYILDDGYGYIYHTHTGISYMIISP